ncbi:MAG: hypothetical protein JKY65_22195 [Planctomycetes bacterium]|nr:hypothetical protein [Planctomycetota bacterium]
MSGVTIGAITAVWLSCTASLLTGLAWTTVLGRGLDAALLGVLAGGVIHLAVHHLPALLREQNPGDLPCERLNDPRS